MKKALAIIRNFLGGVSRFIGRVLTLPIILYQKLVSPLLPARCKYYPSCSSYALQSFRKHGAFYGILLTVWRLLRCNPFSRGGVDHVPERVTIDYFKINRN